MVRPIIQKIKKTFYYSLLALTISLPASLAGAAAATPGTAYFILTPNSGTFNVGDYLTIQVSENSGATGVNFVEPDMNYDKNVLEFQSIDASNTDFPSEMPQEGGGGVVKMPRAILGANLLKDTKIIGTVTFKVIGAANPSSISFATTSSIKAPTSPTTVDDVWNQVTTGASLTLKAIATTPPPSGGSTGSTGSTSSGGKSTTPSTTTKKASPKPGASVTAPTVSTTLPVQTAGPESETEVLAPTSHVVSIKVVNAKDKPVVGAEVKMAGQTTHTISNGTASFVGIADGDYTISVTNGGTTTSKAITVKAQGEPVSSVQNFKVKLTGSTGIPNWVIYTGVGLLILFILGLFIPRKRHNMSKYISAPVAPESIIVGNLKKSTPAPAPKPAPVATPAPKPAPAAEPTPLPTPPPAPVVAPTPAEPQLPKTQTPVTPGTWFKPETRPGSEDDKSTKSNN